MKKFLYAITAMSVFTTSCVKDDIVPEKPEEPTSDITVVINEVMSKDVNDAPDWVELYNTTDEDIDLSGYTINDKEDIVGGSILDAIIIPAKGFVVITDGEEMGESISSGGEPVSLFDADGKKLDGITVPDMSANVGLTYGRKIDGGDEWAVNSATKGSSNGSGSIENSAPIIDASALTEYTDVYSVNASDADGILSVKLVLINNDAVQTLDMAMYDGKFRTSVPKATVGSLIKYYVIATDKTGLTTVYPENGIETPGEYTVVGGINGDLEMSEVQNNSTMLYDFTFSGSVYYPEQVDEVRVYYVFNDVVHDETVDPVLDTKDKVKVPGSDLDADGNFSATIDGLDKGTKVTYYIRVEYKDGTKTYFPMEEKDAEGNIIGDFNHDNSVTWPNVTVGEIPVAPVNGFSELEIVNVNGSELVYNVKVEYDGAPTEIKFYYYVNFDKAAFEADPTGYEDANRISITWEGDLPTNDNIYTFTIPASDVVEGDLVSWYMRAKNPAGDKLYYTFGKTADNFDGDIKDDPTTWHIVTKK